MMSGKTLKSVDTINDENRDNKDLQLQCELIPKKGCCAAQPGQCPRSEPCAKYRHIDFDNGCFQRILSGSDAVSKALDIRKNGERPFNLLKRREGLEQVRVRSHHGVVVRTTFTTLATLLLELAGTRRTKKVNQKQIELPLAS